MGPEEPKLLEGYSVNAKVITYRHAAMHVGTTANDPCRVTPFTKPY